MIAEMSARIEFMLYTHISTGYVFDYCSRFLTGLKNREMVKLTYQMLIDIEMKNSDTKDTSESDDLEVYEY